MLQRNENQRKMHMMWNEQENLQRKKKERKEIVVFFAYI